MLDQLWTWGIWRPGQHLTLLVAFCGQFLSSFRRDSTHFPAGRPMTTGCVNSWCQVTFTWMPGSRVSQQNIALQQDDQCYSLKLWVVLLLQLINNTDTADHSSMRNKYIKNKTINTTTYLCEILMCLIAVCHTQSILLNRVNVLWLPLLLLPCVSEYTNCCFSSMSRYHICLHSQLTCYSSCCVSSRY